MSESILVECCWVPLCCCSMSESTNECCWVLLCCCSMSESILVECCWVLKLCVTGRSTANTGAGVQWLCTSGAGWPGASGSCAATTLWTGYRYELAFDVKWLSVWTCSWYELAIGILSPSGMTVRSLNSRSLDFEVCQVGNSWFLLFSRTVCQLGIGVCRLICLSVWCHRRRNERAGFGCVFCCCCSG